jgi:hypothetical protein
MMIMVVEVRVQWRLVIDGILVMVQAPELLLPGHREDQARVGLWVRRELQKWLALQPLLPPL